MRLVKQLPSGSKQYAAWETEVRKQLKPFADRRADEYAKQTSGWQPNHRPDFQGQVVRQKTGLLALRVIIRNAGKVFNKYGTSIGQLWRMWNEGTRRHIIEPRFASVLRFTIGSRVIFTRRVNHPGTKGTKAKERIDKRLKAGEIKAIRRAGRLAFRKVRKLFG